MPVVPSVAPSPLATSADLAARMQTTFTAAAEAAAEVALRDISAAIRFVTGMSLEDVTADSVVLDGTGGSVVLLPDWPVQAVTSVTVTSYVNSTTTAVLLTEHLDYEWSPAGVLTAASWRGAGGGWNGLGLWGSRPVSTKPTWPDRPRCITVVYDHAPDAATLDVVQSICLEAAARVMTNPDGTVKETIGNYSYDNGPSAGAVGLLSEEEQTTLRSLRGVGVR